MDLSKNIFKTKYQADKRGSITSGLRGKKQSIDYFRITDFEELVRVYGDKPDKLVISFPSNNTEDFINAFKGEYGSNHKLKRICDGDRFSVKYDHQDRVCKVDGNGRKVKTIVDGREKIIYRETGEWLRMDTDYKCNFPKCPCGMNFNFLAFVCDYRLCDEEDVADMRPVTPYLYRFGTHSINIYNAFKTEWNLRLAQGISLIGLKYIISVKMGGAGNIKYPIWELTMPPQRLHSIPNFKSLMAVPTEETQKFLSQGKAKDSLGIFTDIKEKKFGVEDILGQNNKSENMNRKSGEVEVLIPDESDTAFTNNDALGLPNKNASNSEFKSTASEINSDHANSTQETRKDNKAGILPPPAGNFQDELAKRFYESCFNALKNAEKGNLERVMKEKKDAPGWRRLTEEQKVEVEKYFLQITNSK